MSSCEWRQNLFMEQKTRITKWSSDGRRVLFFRCDKQTSDALSHDGLLLFNHSYSLNESLALFLTSNESTRNIWNHLDGSRWYSRMQRTGHRSKGHIPGVQLTDLLRNVQWKAAVTKRDLGEDYRRGIERSLRWRAMTYCLVSREQSPVLRSEQASRTSAALSEEGSVFHSVTRRELSPNDPSTIVCSLESIPTIPTTTERKFLDAYEGSESLSWKYYRVFVRLHRFRCRQSTNPSALFRARTIETKKQMHIHRSHLRSRELALERSAWYRWFLSALPVVGNCATYSMLVSLESIVNLLSSRPVGWTMFGYRSFATDKVLRWTPAGKRFDD